MPRFIEMAQGRERLRPACVSVSQIAAAAACSKMFDYLREVRFSLLMFSPSLNVDRNKVVTTSSVNLSLHDGSASWLDKFPSIQVFTENELMLSPVSPYALVTNGRTPFVQDRRCRCRCPSADAIGD